MLKVLALTFLFVFTFSAGTLVGSHFKDQIDTKSREISNKIKNVDTERIVKGSLPEKLKEIAEEESPPPREKFKPMPQKRRRNTARKTSSSGNGNYTVQVASFPSSALAEDMTRKLRNQGYDAMSFSAVIKGKTWYRVGIGRFSSIGEANKKQRKLVTDKVVRDSIISRIR